MPCFEGVGFSFFVSPGNGKCKNRMVTNGSFDYTVRTFITEDAFVTWDPDEFNVKRIQGKKKVINVTTE